jgi:hypothetical protein
MDKLLKEAIADAKAVRETALANAKIALEEAFAPKLQSMLAAKLAEEDEETVDVGLEDTIGEDDEIETQDDGVEVDAVEAAEEAAQEDEEEAELGETISEDDYAEDTEEGGEQAQEEEDAEYAGDEETPDEEDITAELAEIIRELEEDSEEEELHATEDELGAEDKKADELEEEDEEENIDLDEIIKALKEEDEEEAEVEDAELEVTAEYKLKEAYNVIRTLKGQLTEVNVLNAKLLYANKLFRTYTLSESEKMKVIEAVDRAKNVREIKLVYSTLAESFGNPNRTSKKKVVEGFASKATASTRPPKQKILTEADAQAERFKKLAGLIK